MYDALGHLVQMSPATRPQGGSCHPAAADRKPSGHTRRTIGRDAVDANVFAGRNALKQQQDLAVRTCRQVHLPRPARRTARMVTCSGANSMKLHQSTARAELAARAVCTVVAPSARISQRDGCTARGLPRNCLQSACPLDGLGWACDISGAAAAPDVQMCG